MNKLLDLLINKRIDDEKIIFTLSRLINESKKENIIQYIISELSNDNIFFNTILYDLNCLLHEDFENKKIISDMINDIEKERKKYPSWLKLEIEKIKTKNLSYIEVFIILVEKNIADLDIIKNYVKFDKTIREIIQIELEDINLIRKEKSFIDLDWD